MPIGGVACEDGVEYLIQLPSDYVCDYTVENFVKARHGRRREQSSVKEDDGEFDRCQGHTIVEGVCEDELELSQINQTSRQVLLHQWNLTDFGILCGFGDEYKMPSHSKTNS